MEGFRLLVPGPVEIPEEVRRVGSERLPYMRTAEFSALTFEVVDGLRQVVGTVGDVLLLTASGTAAMEAAVLALFRPGDRVLVIVGGTFGRRFAEIGRIHQVSCDTLDLEPGRDLVLGEFADRVRGGSYAGVLVNAHETSTGALVDVEAMGRVLRGTSTLLVVDAIGTLCADPYRMDEWGVDATLFSTQKGLALPPGMAFVALGPRARERALSAPRRSLYLHLADYLKDGERGQTPYTVAVGLVLQLRERLRRLLAAGVEAEVAATRERAMRFRRGIEGLPVEVLPERPSNALTAVRLCTRAVTAPEVVRRLAEEFGLVVAPNPEPLRERVFRVAHLGAQTDHDVESAILALREVLGGFPREEGS